jgi:hypothetical protein
MQTMNAEDKIPEAGKPDEIEITPEMIEAGVMAYYGVASEGWGWEGPGPPGTQADGPVCFSSNGIFV